MTHNDPQMERLQGLSEHDPVGYRYLGDSLTKWAADRIERLEAGLRRIRDYPETDALLEDEIWSVCYELLNDEAQP